jgi:sterol desaturase/sphingolipid hydroxylase (fatty acid hydroxylase superfamily)
VHAAISPASGHSGFYKYVVAGDEETEEEKALRAGGYFHYLHHRFFTVNFGNEEVPLDKWFGSFHDGTPEAHAAMISRRKTKAKK